MSNYPGDLKDSKHDNELLKAEETTIDLPEVKDIPGQEHIRPLPAGEMADTTISSADEEGEGLLDDLNKEDDEDGLNLDSDTIVTAIEQDLLKKAAGSVISEDTEEMHRAELDHTDDDGTPLNEESSFSKQSGSDLDIPGAELDDNDEKIGEEDEENNNYSLSQK
ncbi:MAG: hypothetical protein ABI921_05845 [Panacibacter sp.]